MSRLLRRLLDKTVTYRFNERLKRRGPLHA